jgi:anti-anti-sigma regulatory factor
VAGGVAAVWGAGPSVARVLGMTGFDRIAKLHSTVRDAAAELLVGPPPAR